MSRSDRHPPVLSLRAPRVAAMAMRVLVVVSLCCMVAGPLVARRAHAQDSLAAEAVLLRGVLKVRRAGEERFYRRTGVPIPLTETDVIQTGKDTRATVRLLETGETMQMYSNSHIVLADLRSRLTAVDLNVGKALFGFVKGLFADRDIQVTTETATIGVKGTDFLVAAEKDQTFVMTVQGTVDVTSKAEPSRSVDVRPDQLYYVTADEVPAAAAAIEPETRERILQEEGLEALREETGLAGPRDSGDLGLQLRLGVASHELGFGLSRPGRSSSRRTFTSSGVLASAEYELIGPVLVSIDAFAGELVNSDGDPTDPDAFGNQTGGEAQSLMALIGVGGVLGDSWAWGIHGGVFATWLTIPRASTPSGRATLNLRGPMAKLGLDYLFEGGPTLGLSFHYGQGTPAGQEVDRLEALGYKVGTAELELYAVSLGGRF